MLDSDGFEGPLVAHWQCADCSRPVYLGDAAGVGLPACGCRQQRGFRPIELIVGLGRDVVPLEAGRRLVKQIMRNRRHVRLGLPA